MRVARVQFGGIVRQVSLDFVPEAGLGDYVMVHVGFAISRVDASKPTVPTSFCKRWGCWKQNWRQPIRKRPDLPPFLFEPVASIPRGSPVTPRRDAHHGYCVG